MSRISYRRLDGILLLDKPAGISSNSALQVARRLLRAKKGGILVAWIHSLLDCCRCVLEKPPKSLVCYWILPRHTTLTCYSAPRRRRMMLKGLYYLRALCRR